MSSFFIEAPIEVVRVQIGDQEEIIRKPDVDFEVEGAVPVLTLAKGTPDELVIWHVNGSGVDSQKIGAEKAKGRLGFEKGKPGPSKLERALDAHHKFAGE